MIPPILTFFNNKGGVGKTSLIYHLAWMFASLHKRVVIMDLDPQANLTAAFLEEESVEILWSEQLPGSTIYQCVKPLIDVSDITEPVLHKVASNLYLIPGDVNLSGFEETLSDEWPKSLRSKHIHRQLRVLSSFWQIAVMAAKKVQADIILVDIGPNLGAINRSALIAADYVVIPLGADLYSLQGLKNLGPTLNEWKKEWDRRLENWENSNDIRLNTSFQLPKAKMEVIGYVCQQHGVLLNRPVKAYDKWVNRIPDVYREAILNLAKDSTIKPSNDPFCLATIKHYRSLIPMAQEHRKPIFNLTSADGAIGSHAGAVQDARKDFKLLAEKIAKKIGVQL